MDFDVTNGQTQYFGNQDEAPSPVHGGAISAAVVAPIVILVAIA